MNLEEISSILDEIAYRDWQFCIFTQGNCIVMQVAFLADGQKQRGRKWILSQLMTRSEVVQTALKAVLSAEEHEAREKFLYQGVPVFGPHFDVDELARRVPSLDARTPRFRP